MSNQLVSRVLTLNGYKDWQPQEFGSCGVFISVLGLIYCEWNKCKLCYAHWSVDCLNWWYFVPWLTNHESEMLSVMCIAFYHFKPSLTMIFSVTVMFLTSVPLFLNQQSEVFLITYNLARGLKSCPNLKSCHLSFCFITFGDHMDSLLMCTKRL